MTTRNLCAALISGLCMSILMGPGAPWSHAQAASNGAILGTVTDPSGAVVPDAAVTISNINTGARWVTHTDAGGRYDLEALPAAGTFYNVSVKKEGFKTEISQGVKLSPSERVTLNVTLSVGTSVSEVTVEAAAVHVDTSSGESSGTITGTEIQELQLNGRDFRGLALLIPGVNSAAITGRSVGGGSLNGGGLTGETPISVNGEGREMNMYTTDGAYNMNTGNEINLNVTQPIDSIAEFRMLKDNYSAKYGIAGGAQIALATKSGTREFRGSLYDYLRNDKLDARNFFNPNTEKLHQNIFGGSVGGPVYIPGKYNTDKTKTFFFASVEARRRNVGLVLRGAMIPEPMRNGDFTNSPTFLASSGLKLDSTGAALMQKFHPGVNCVPDSTHLNSACFDTNAVAIMNRFWPLPNNPGGGFLNYINNGVDEFNVQDHTYRIDQYFSPRFQLLARVSYETATDSPPALNWGSNPAPTESQQIKTTGFNNLLRFTANISPTTINQVSWTQTYDKPRLRNLNDTRNTVPGFSIDLPFGQQADISNRVPNISLARGWAGTSDGGLPQDASDGEQVFSEDFTKVRGPHTIQAGTLFIFGIKRQSGFSTPEGSFSFSGVHAGDPVADYLLGLDSSFSQSNTRLRGYFRYRQSESYIQDDWKPSRRLTLNLGVRAVYFTSDKIEGNGVSDFDPNRWNAANAPVVLSNGQLLTNAQGQPVTASGSPADLLNGVVFPEDFKGGPGIPSGTSGVPDGIFTTTLHWAPRVGFAWDVFGDGKTALRGGYGIGYGRIPFDIYNQDLGNPPFINSVTLLNGTLTAPALGSPGALTVKGMGSIGPPGGEFKPTKTHTWSLTVQREVLPNGVLSVAYVGTASRNIPGSRDINFPLPVSAPSVNDPRCLSPGESANPTGGFQFDPCLNRGVVSSAITRPFVGWSGISDTDAGAYEGQANYNSLQTGFNYRAGRNLTFTTAYTYGKALSDVASRGFDARQTNNGAQNPRNFQVEYGPVGFDRTHIFTSGYVWNLPLLEARSGIVAKAFGGWTFSGVTVIESGFVFAPGMATGTSGLASRPNCVGSISGPKTVSQWFNTAAFAAPAFGLFGNCGTGIIRGPRENTWNWAMYKSFPVRERVKLQFRSEFFNIWNHPSFSSVSTGFGSPNFGQVTGALEPRQIEFALRLDF